MKKILVTGANGLLGSKIIKLLADSELYAPIAFVRKSSDVSLLKNIEVEMVYGDVNEINSLTEALVDIDAVIHTAAYVSYDPGNDDLMRKVNIEGTANVVNECLMANVSKFVHISSVAAIGRDDSIKTYTENTKWVNAPYNSPYGISKYQAEQEAWRAYHEGLPTTILNPSLILGDGDFSKTSLVIVDKIIKSKGLHPRGSNAFVDVDDVAVACIKALDHAYDGQRFIIAAENKTYKELYETVSKAMGIGLNLRPVPKWLAYIIIGFGWLKYKLTGKPPLLSKMAYTNSSLSIKYDNSKSVKVLGMKYTPFEVTVDKMIAAYKNSKI